MKLIKDNKYYISYIDHISNKCFLDHVMFLGTVNYDKYQDGILGCYANLKLLEIYSNNFGWEECNDYGEWWFVGYEWIFIDKEDALNRYFKNLKLLEVKDILV